MEDIEIGEYVRTNEGIAKIHIIENNRIFDEYNNCAFLNDILKHSKNLIDLVEVGDIVNDELIVYKGRVASGKEKLLGGNRIISGIALEFVDIKTILTHEQFENNCYKVGDNL